MQRLDPGEFFILGLDNMPGGEVCGGAGEHLVDSSFVKVPLFPVAPVFVRDLPALFRGIHPVLEPAELFFLVNLQPKFYNDSAPIV